MGNAKKFKSSIDTIADNNEVQNYIANFHEYGVITNLVFFQIKSFTSPLLDLEDGVGQYIEGFYTYAGAMQQAIKRVPTQFFTDRLALTQGEQTAAFVTIMAALGIAMTVDMQKSGMFDQANDFVEDYESLNIVDLY